MADHETGEIKLKAFKEFYSKLVKVLPMDNISSDLYSHDLLPGDNKARIEALDTQKQKAEYFLDKVIKPGMLLDTRDSLM